MTSENTLTIEDDLCLSATHETVLNIISDNKIHELIFEGTENVFEEEYIDTDTYKRFWLTLAKTVNEMYFFTQAPDNVDEFFDGIKTLWIDDEEILDSISTTFFDKNPLEDVTIDVSLINWYNTNEEKFHKSLIQLLKTQKSLKTFTFDCDIPLIDTIINEIFAQLNYEFFEMDDVIFDCDPIPSWNDYENSFWVLKRVQFEFCTKETQSKVIIKPIRLEEDLKECEMMCVKNCSMNHKGFKSDSVRHLKLEENDMKKCVKFVKNCMEQFPLLETITGLYFDDERIFQSISQSFCFLTEINSMIYDGPVVHSFMSFPNLKTLEIAFETSNYESFENLVQSCQCLEKLHVIITRGISDDACVEIVTRNLGKIEDLSISCEETKLTEVGLELIKNNLKSLILISFNCSENIRKICELFHRILTLQAINNSKSSILRDDFSRTELMETEFDDVVTSVHINILPVEVLDKIFGYLNKKDQRKLRLICKNWFKICSTSLTLDRVLDLQSVYLSANSNPVKILTTTSFKYNKIFLYEDTKFSQDDLTEFWEKIGAEIEEIRFFERHSTFIKAFQCGLLSQHLPKLRTISVGEISVFYELLLENTPEWKTLLCDIKKIVRYYKFENFYSETHTSHVEFTMTNVVQLEIEGFWKNELFEFFHRITFPKLETFIIKPGTDQKLESIFQANLDFSQLRSLFVGKLDDWKEADFLLIIEKCVNLRNLGIVISIEEKELNDDDEVTGVSYKNLIEKINCKRIVEMMFNKMYFLSGVYFVRYKDNKAQSWISYLRTGVDRIIESNETYRLFENITI